MTDKITDEEILSKNDIHILCNSPLDIELRKEEISEANWCLADLIISTVVSYYRETWEQYFD